jgi:hypothetical protein
VVGNRLQWFETIANHGKPLPTMAKLRPAP